MFLGAAVSAAAAAVGPAPVVSTVERPNPDLTALQGMWRLIAMEKAGKRVRRALEPAQTWTVKDRWIDVRSGEGAPVREVFQVWPERSPKQIDVNAHPVGLFIPSDVVKGIYTLTGDTWKVCLRDASATPSAQPPERPTAFTTRPNALDVLVTLERVKPQPQGDTGSEHRRR